MKPFDLAIIGAGAAGLIGARFAAQLGARVALIDRGPIGGDCTWTGCIPSKSLIHVAKVAHQMQRGRSVGIHCDAVHVDWNTVMEFVHGTIDEVYTHTTPEALESEGISVRLGNARFISPTGIEVGKSETLSAKSTVICVGAKPRLPSIEGLEEVPFLTYQTLFELKHRPESMAVIGGGPIGIEMAQAFARLGTSVTLFAPEVLPREEPEAVSHMISVLRSEGIRLVLEKVDRVEREGESVRVISAGERVQVHQILVSTGRIPQLEGLNLEAASIKYSDRGIEVDHALRTSAKNIYAAGDCIGGEQFSHLAGWQAWQAVRTALLPGSGGGIPPINPRTTFTDPEVAQVGMTYEAAQAKFGPAAKFKILSLQRVDRALCDEDTGFIKLIHHGNKLLGGTVVSSHAGELINELSLAIRFNLGLDKLAGTIHAYPTYGSALQLMATEIATTNFLHSRVGKLAQSLAGL